MTVQVAGNAWLVNIVRRRRAAARASSTSAGTDAVGRLSLAETDARDDEERLTTPFEDWCEATGTHPEAPGAWEDFTAGRRPAG